MLSLCMAALAGQIMHLEDSDCVGREVSVGPRAASQSLEQKGSRAASLPGLLCSKGVIEHQETAVTNLFMWIWSWGWMSTQRPAVDASAEGFPQFPKGQGVKHTHCTGGIIRF